LLFENYGQEVGGGDQYIVGPQPKSWGPVSPGGCCVYVSAYYKYGANQLISQLVTLFANNTVTQVN